MNMKHISEPDPSNVDRVINTITEGAIIGPSLFKGLTGVYHGMDGSRCSVFSFPLCLLMESLHSCHAMVQRALGVSSLNPFDAIGLVIFDAIQALTITLEHCQVLLRRIRTGLPIRSRGRSLAINSRL
jgi:hypothetical protein